MGSRLSGPEGGDTLGCSILAAIGVVVVLVIAVAGRIAYQFAGPLGMLLAVCILGGSVIVALAAATVSGRQSNGG